MCVCACVCVRVRLRSRYQHFSFMPLLAFPGVRSDTPVAGYILATD